MTGQVPRRIIAFAVAVLIAVTVGGTLVAKHLLGSNAAETVANRNGQLQAQAKNAPKGTAVPFLGPFAHHHKGVQECGPAVKLMEAALKNAHLRKGVPRNCVGPATVAQLKAFQRSIHYKPTGTYNRPTHLALVKRHAYTKDARAQLYFLQYQRRVLEVKKTVDIVAAHVFLVGRTSLPYSEGPSRQNLPAWPRIPPATDCSGMATYIAYQSGYGLAVGYMGPGSIVGWTGTLSLYGRAVPPTGPLQVGDFVFYGSGYPWSHVAVYIGHGLVITHGGRGVQELPWNYLYGYRTLQVRRYL